MNRPFVFALSLCLSAVAHAQKPNDVFGWSDTKWGMTATEVMKTQAGAEMKAQDEDAKSTLKGYSLPDIEIDAYTFTVALGFEKTSGKLTTVNVKPKRKNPTELDFKTLESSLISKYGTPTYSSNRSASDFSIRRRWVFPSTTIELTLVDLPEIKQTLVFLYYEPTKKNPL